MSVGSCVGPSVRPSVRHISGFPAVLVLLLLPNRPRLSCRVSGLVIIRFPSTVVVVVDFVDVFDDFVVFIVTLLAFPLVG